MYAENSKVLLKETKEDLYNWREIVMGWKIQHSICIKIRLFCRYKIILKLLWKGKITRKFWRKIKVRKTTLSNFKTFYSYSNKYCSWWRDLKRDWHIDQWNRYRSHTNMPNWVLIRAKAIEWRKYRLFHKWSWSNRTLLKDKKDKRTELNNNELKHESQTDVGL